MSLGDRFHGRGPCAQPFPFVRKCSDIVSRFFFRFHVGFEVTEFRPFLASPAGQSDVCNWRILDGRFIDPGWLKCEQEQP